MVRPASGLRGTMMQVSPLDVSTDPAEVIRFRRRHLPSRLSLSDEIKIWTWKIADNPFRDSGMPAAYVARSENRVVGLIGLMPGRICLAEKNFQAIGLTDFCVDAASQGAGIDLLARVIEKYESHVLFSASANAVSSELFRHLRFYNVPVATYAASTDEAGSEAADPRTQFVEIHEPSEEPLLPKNGRTSFSHVMDTTFMQWRYGRYPLAKPLTATVGKFGRIVMQKSDIRPDTCLALMDICWSDKLEEMDDEMFKSFLLSLKSYAKSHACEQTALTVAASSVRPGAFARAGFLEVDPSKNPSCWFKVPDGIGVDSASLDRAYVSLGTGDRFLTNAVHPPIAQGRPRVFTYSLKESDDSLEAVALRKTLLIRTSPFDHWSLVLERFLKLCGPENLRVLSNSEMPESFPYLYPSFRTLIYPRGELAFDRLPKSLLDQLRSEWVDQVVLSTHALSARYPDEIRQTFLNVIDAVRKIWPDDAIPIWAADRNFELKRLDDRYLETGALSSEKSGVEYLHAVVRNHLGALLPHVEMFNSLLSNPSAVSTLPAQRCVMIAPHQDDEIIGCGGTIANLVSEGKSVQTVYLTDGAYATARHTRAEMPGVRRIEALEVAAWMNIPEPVFLNFPTHPTFSVRDEHVAALSDVLKRLDPDSIWIPFVFERHPDHRRANLLLRRALKAIDRPQMTIYFYEVWSPLPANILVDITRHMEKKRKAVALFKSQSASFDYVHAVTGTNAARSWMVNGSGYHEAFFKLSSPEYLRLVDAIESFYPE